GTVTYCNLAQNSDPVGSTWSMTSEPANIAQFVGSTTDPCVNVQYNAPGVVHLRLDVVGADPLCGNFDTTTVVVKPFAVATAGPQQRKCGRPSGLPAFTVGGSGPEARPPPVEAAPRGRRRGADHRSFLLRLGRDAGGAGPCLAALELTTSNDCGAATDTVV